MTRRTAPGAAALVACLTTGAVRGAAAQPPAARPELFRGRVTLDSAGTPAPNATVTVTRGPDRQVKSTTTGADGRWQLAYPNGTGDYLVSVTAIGRAPVRKRVTRGAPGYPAAGPAGASDSVYTVDARLAPVAANQLATVHVEAKRPKPERRDRSPFGERTPGAADQDVSGFNGAVAPDQAGDLGALAATTPGVTLTPGGASVLGLGAGQTNVTLGGLGFAGGSLPRDARTTTRVTTSTYDPALGWFSGARVAVELAPGFSFSSRRAHVTADAPFLQRTDATGAALGQRVGALQVSAGGEGALADDRWTYNVSGQLSRRAQDAPALLGADPGALLAAGVAPDSAARLAALARAAGIPLGTASGAWNPTTRLSDEAVFLARVDAPTHDPKTYEPTRRTYGVTAYGSLGRGSALGVGPTALATRGGQSSTGSAALQAVYSAYVGRNGDRLVDLRTGISASDARNTPYLLLPGATVLVGSGGGVGSGDTVAAPALSALALGGNAGFASRRRTSLWETQGELRFLPPKRAKHRITLTADARLDGLRDDPGADRLGTYSYQSLDDLAAGRPAAFSRALAAPTRAARVWNGFVAAGDYWRPSDRLQLLYGARLEGNAYAARPDYNPALDRALGVDTRRVPNTVGLSPRLGFTWQAVNRHEGVGMSFNNFGLSIMRPRGVLRGGVGQFRNLLGADAVAQAAAATGLPGAARRLLCVGDAVPAPQWSAWAAGQGAYPDACLAGAAGASLAALGDTARPATAFGRGYTAPRSWRGNLAWNSVWHAVNYGVEGVLSYNLDQPGTVDANFAGAPRFTLGAEGRPVFVDPAAIVPATGALAPAGARVTPAFSRVALLTSELRSVSRQLTVTLAPENGVIGGYNHTRGIFTLAGAYTLGGVRQQQRGFDAAAFGDPRVRAWGRGDLDVRHQFLVQGGYSVKGVTFQLYSRFQSGLPFTPLVGGDVNGDGLANDRAFVFDPNAAGPAAPDSAVAAGTRALLATAPSGVRACLAHSLGAAAARNACEGPWTASMNARLGYNGTLPRLGRRVGLSLNFTNPLGGLDQLFHGDRLRGWGAPALPDPVLYQVRGFDPATNRFRYAVNPRFGDTRPSATAFRLPFRATLDVSLDLGRPIGEQQIDKWLRPGRAGHAGVKLTADELKKRYARNVPDPYAAILQESDSLLLTRPQADAITAIQTRYRARMDSLWSPLAEYLAALPDHFDPKETLKRQEAAIDAAWEISRQDTRANLPPVLAPTQLRVLPWPADMYYRAKEPIKGARMFMGG